MSSTFRNSAAILAILVGMGGAAYAQTAAETAPAAPDASAAPEAPVAPPAPPAPVTITEENLPELLKGLALQNIDIDQDGRHIEVQGDLADGLQIEARLDRKGQLRKVEADDGADLPAAVIEALVPQAVRDAETYGQFATVKEIGLAPADGPMQGVMIGGVDANGEKVRAMFANDGTLERFGRGDDDHRGKRGGKHDDRGPRGPHGDNGPRGPHGDHGPRGPHGDHGQPPAPPAPLDEAAVGKILTDAGFTGLGAINRDGPRTLVDAVNAAGENVTVEIGPRGDVVRETAR